MARFWSVVPMTPETIVTAKSGSCGARSRVAGWNMRPTAAISIFVVAPFTVDALPHRRLASKPLGDVLNDACKGRYGDRKRTICLRITRRLNRRWARRRKELNQFCLVGRAALIQPRCPARLNPLWKTRVAFTPWPGVRLSSQTDTPTLTEC